MTQESDALREMTKPGDHRLCVQCRRGPVRPGLYRMAVARPWPLAWQRPEAAGGPAPARQAAALCFITYQFLLKRKPYKFNQLFIWKHLTFFPLELFDIIVLRVRIKKKKKSRCVIVVDTVRHPFLAGVQVSFQ